VDLREKLGYAKLSIMHLLKSGAFHGPRRHLHSLRFRPGDFCSQQAWLTRFTDGDVTRRTISLAACQPRRTCPWFDFVIARDSGSSRRSRAIRFVSAHVHGEWWWDWDESCPNGLRVNKDRDIRFNSFRSYSYRSLFDGFGNIDRDRNGDRGIRVTASSIYGGWMRSHDGSYIYSLQFDMGSNFLRKRRDEHNDHLSSRRTRRWDNRCWRRSSRVFIPFTGSILQHVLLLAKLEIRAPTQKVGFMRVGSKDSGITAVDDNSGRAGSLASLSDRYLRIGTWHFFDVAHPHHGHLIL
jgi:hypothetical protein